MKREISFGPMQHLLCKCYGVEETVGNTKMSQLSLGSLAFVTMIHPHRAVG